MMPVGLYPEPLTKRIGLLGLCIAVAAAILFYAAAEPRQPVADEIFYLKHAWSLHAHDVLARATPDQGVSGAALAAPGLPSVLAAVMDIDPHFAARARCWLAAEPSGGPAGGCAAGLGSFRLVAAGLMGICTALLFFTGTLVAGRMAAGGLAVVAWSVTDVPWRFSNALLSEVLSLPLLFSATLIFALGVIRVRWSLILAAGLGFGLVALVRPVHGYVGPLIMLAAPFALRLIGGAGWRRAVSVAIAGGVGVLAVTGTSLLLQPDRDTQSKVYGARQLTWRVAYNRMTPNEYLAAWVYWLPDFGDDWARGMFGQGVVDRFSFSKPQGFYVGGAQAVAAEVQEATGVDVVRRIAPENAPSPLLWLVEHKIVGDLPAHAAVSAVLAWRGLFVGKLVGLLGLVALVILVGSRSWDDTGNRRRLLLALALPPTMALVFQAGISINIPRYNIGMVQLHAVALGTAVAFGVAALFRRLGRRRSGAWRT